MNKKLLQLYSLKWNPFAPDVPTEALWVSPRLDHFGWRLEQLVREGGFALISGDPGVGKSTSMRGAAERLGGLRDVVVGVVERPQSGVSDFYRELGHVFGVSLGQRNRWGGFKALRDKWQSHIEATLLRPVLFIDEAQEMSREVLAELRVLVSAHFDSRALLTVVLCGDRRLLQRFESDDAFVPLASRIRARLLLEALPPDTLAEILRHSIAQAGNARLLSPELVTTLAEHAAGNLRVLHGLAADLLAAAAQRELRQLDEKLYLELFAPPTEGARPARTAARAGRTR
jgi:type II secretory pathway predicted ATPase ExeA